MAKLVGAFASSHAPLMARAWESVGPERLASIKKTFAEMGRRFKEAKPDVLVVISPDHWVNFFINNLPSICVGVGEEHEGPAEPWMKACPYKKIAGHPKFANHIVETALERDFEPSVSHHLTLDHGFCIPLWRGGLDPRARALNLSAPTCSSTSGFATRFRYHNGCLGAPPLDATTR